jgi:aspartyl-tRNA(Asn)/glutamyl-tRNA(Gln) amidotransferase subunit C
MSLTKQQVEHVAKLACLELSEAEKEKFTQQLGAILSYVEQLDALDTKNVEPTAHVLPLKNVLRADDLKPSLGRDQVLANAPDPFKGSFRVPKILDGASEKEK